MSKIVTFIFILFSGYFSAQHFFEYSDTLNKPRRNILLATEFVGATTSLILLNEVWYKNYPRVDFKIFNDNEEWLKMDKVGHAMTSYYVGLIGLETLKWSGAKKNTYTLLGGGLGLIYLTGVEFLDGTSANWGFSWGDMLANAAGAGLLIGQEYLWNEQRIKFKYSYHSTPYSAVRPNVLGSNSLESALKDYNGQTYWLSANIKDLLIKNKDSKFPGWLCVSAGYGAEEMIAGTDDAQFCQDNPLLCAEYNRYSQFYLSLDIDLTKFDWKKKWLKTVMGSIGWIKIPAPALEINKNGLAFKPLYF